MPASLPELLLSNTCLAALLAICAAFCARHCRKPSVAHGLWLLVFLKMITPPLLTPAFQIEFAAVPPAPPVNSQWSDVNVARSSPPRITQQEPLLVATIPLESDLPRSEVEFAETRREIIPVLLTLWSVGTAGWFVLLAWRTLRFHQMTRHARPAPQHVQQQLRHLAERFGISNTPEIRVIHARISPLLWRMGGKPLILLPAELLAELSSDQVATVLAHELAHLQRRDHWTRRLMLLAIGLYWWHPLVWWARRGLLQAEEQCCDAWVVAALPDHNRSYAAALLQTIDFLTGARPSLPVSATAFGQGRILKRRFEMILDKGVSVKLSWKMRGALWTAALAVLGVSPFVVAEEAADPPQPQVIGHSGKPYVTAPPVTKKTKTAKNEGKAIYRISCRMFERDESGKENFLFAPQIALNAGESGSVLVGNKKPILIPQAKTAATIKPVAIGNSIEILVNQLEDDFVLFDAKIEYTPGMTSARFPDDDGLVEREYTHVFTQQLRVVEKVRLGGKFFVPFDGSADLESAKRHIEFEIDLLKPAKRKSPDEAVITMASPIKNAPSEQDIRTAILDAIKKRNDAPAFAQVTSIKNLKVFVMEDGDKIRTAKSNPQFGQANSQTRRFRCHATFDLERESNWPVLFKHQTACQEVIYIDHDILIRNNPEGK